MARKTYSPELKAKVALEAVRNDMTIAQLSKKHGIHPTLIQKWKTDLIKQSALVFAKGAPRDDIDEAQIARLERKVGQLTIENDFLKKNVMGYRKGSE